MNLGGVVRGLAHGPDYPGHPAGDVGRGLGRRDGQILQGGLGEPGGHAELPGEHRGHDVPEGLELPEHLPDTRDHDPGQVLQRPGEPAQGEQGHREVIGQDVQRGGQDLHGLGRADQEPGHFFQHRGQRPADYTKGLARLGQGHYAVGQRHQRR
ncbi:MAG: hypothetical protein M5U12_06755 [Verrucomicrobia bacterium]|nr:hypothetical protein [Verrucomicrobiota bacterium]